MSYSKKDFFISYQHRDSKWAHWIAWQLEEAHYSVIIQDWDFGAGSNFVYEMDKAARESNRLIIVLSNWWFSSNFTQAEFASYFGRDPNGIGRKIIPVRVEECKPTGLLQNIVYIDLIGKDEAAAREELLARVNPGRAKPLTRSPYPVKHTVSNLGFPGNQIRTIRKVSQTHVPKKTIVLKKNSRKKIIAWTITAVLLVILAFLAILHIAEYFNYMGTPAYTLDGFCTAMQNHQWDSAYAYFDKPLQQKVSKSQFITSINTVANKYDELGECTSKVVSQHGTIATVKITYTFGNGYSIPSEQYELFQDPINGWSFHKYWKF